LVLLEAYFDESGDLESTGNFCIAGYLFKKEYALQMEGEWRAVLDRYGVEYFHSKECIPGATGPCKHLCKSKRAQMVIELIDLIDKYAGEGFGFVARKQFYDVKGKDAKDVYSWYADLAVNVLQAFLEGHRAQGEITYIFESGHEHQRQARNLIANSLMESSNTVVFKPKKTTALLQAADLIAWQLRKYEQDVYTQERPPRKDFLALMEHQHTFYYLSMPKNKDHATVMMEEWPVSRRPKNDMGIRRFERNPIPHFIGSDGVPIFLLLRALGYADGGTEGLFCKFESGLGGNLILQMSEISVYELIGFLANASADVYKDGALQLNFSMKEFQISETDSGTHIRIKTEAGTRFNFNLKNSASKDDGISEQ
jgi:hypothetical protein